MTNIRTVLLLPLVSFALIVAPFANAQDDATKILGKMRQVDILNLILPVLMTPEQIQKLLLPIERARKAVKDIEKAELVEMKKIEGKLDLAIKEAKEKSLVPSSEVQKDIVKLLTTFSLVRSLMEAEQNEAVLKVVEESLDEGQIKSATNSLTFSGSGGVKLSDRAKLGRWVRAVLLDPVAYDLLIELSRKK